MNIRKIIKTTLLVSTLFTPCLSEAGLPEFSAITKSPGLNQHTSSIFTLTRKAPVSVNTAFSFNPLATMSTPYITGQVKKKENTFKQVLGWDFKVKFRLSQNLNIIFSYN